MRRKALPSPPGAGWRGFFIFSAMPSTHGSATGGSTCAPRPLARRLAACSVCSGLAVPFIIPSAAHHPTEGLLCRPQALNHSSFSGREPCQVTDWPGPCPSQKHGCWAALLVHVGRAPSRSPLAGSSFNTNWLCFPGPAKCSPWSPV